MQKKKTGNFSFILYIQKIRLIQLNQMYLVNKKGDYLELNDQIRVLKAESNVQHKFD